jgi:hypothetical protein
LAVIIKGKSRGNGAQLGTYLVTQGKNEHIRVIEVRGVVAEDVPGAVYEMDALSIGARTEKGLYHAQINARAEERLTDEQRAIAVDRLEEKLGLTGQPRVVVVHEKEGREHCHVVWSRIDLDRMAAISDSNNYRKHEEVARALEREFGHERVQGAHAERGGKERPERTPSHYEMLQSERTGVSPAAARALMTELWRKTDSGKSFQATLETKWWVLARGDRREFVAIDSEGGVHSLSRRIEGAKAADVQQRFADLDPKLLPTVAQAMKLQHARQGERARQAEARAIERSRPKADHARASAGPRERTPGIRGIARPAAKIAGSVFSALMGESPTPKEKESDSAPDTKGEATPSQRRQELMRQLSREIPQETERDAEYEADKGRERSRG